MLGIIFTRRRLFAAWSDNGLIKWIPVGLSGKKYVFHSGEYLPTLQNHFNHIYKAAQWHAFGNGMTPLESPSLALVFPGDDASITASEKQVILNWITSLSVEWSSVRSAELGAALAHALTFHFSEYTLFEALDGQLNLYTSIPEISKKIPFLDLNNLGADDGAEHIYQVINAELHQRNLVLPADALTDLRVGIEDFEVGKKLIINFSDGFAKVSLDLSLSLSRYYDLLTWKRDRYFDILSFLVTDLPSACSVLFVSDLFDNPVFREYICNLVRNKISPEIDIRFYGETKALEKVITYLSTKPANVGPGGKEDLLAEIKLKCTDRRKYRNYLDKYLPLARKLGIPDEMIIWQIRQSINSLQKLSEIGEVVERPDRTLLAGLPTTLTDAVIHQDSHQKNDISPLPKKNENIFEKNATIETPKPYISETKSPKEEIIRQFDPDLSFLDQNLLSRIADFATFEEKFPDREFISFKGKLLSDKQSRVFRVLKNNADDYALKLFEKLQDRENSYYKDCSGIEQTSLGDLYFYRPFFDGELLETYVRRTGLHKKFRLKDISALDLELMLELWRIVYRLKFCFGGLTKDSFIVSVHWRLPLKREIEVKLINIDSSDSDKPSMEAKMTEIFQETFGENLTAEFLKQFRNH